jgi:hypothetical protein
MASTFRLGMFAGIGGIQLEMMAAGLFLPVHAKQQRKCQFCIMNTVISAALYPQKDKLCYFVPTVLRKDKSLLLFPQKDKLCGLSR